MMQLIYLPANQAWVFTFGDSLIRMGDAPMLLATRQEAIDAAGRCGMDVDAHGEVTSRD